MLSTSRVLSFTHFVHVDGLGELLFLPENLDIISTCPCIWHSLLVICDSPRWQLLRLSPRQGHGAGRELKLSAALLVLSSRSHLTKLWSGFVPLGDARGSGGSSAASAGSTLGVRQCSSCWFCPLQVHLCMWSVSSGNFSSLSVRQFVALRHHGFWLHGSILH